ncbi:hypothetical protein N7333_08255 [Pseudomonas sp. GD04158]|uniref:hypothetical protein n=1 Tax=Pseudomonas sp. GD04158 TaxID=2975439 RepID=UPI00244BCE85|nr:hypothetical protein [Pseudomonas sp. GD04158]MDH0096565.1 hypothetical protein [Pseudomonas sp. GD04158]
MLSVWLGRCLKQRELEAIPIGWVAMARTPAIRFPVAVPNGRCCKLKSSQVVREARSVIVEGAAFTHRNRAGEDRRVVLEHYERRPLVDDLERVTQLSIYGKD